MRHPFPRLLLVIALASSTVAVLAPAPALAQQRPDLDKAKTHYGAAEKAMQAGDYAKASTEYQAAYDITKDPVLFFKLATAYEKAGKCDQAVVFYRRYLNEGQPDENFKALAEERVAACEPGVTQAPEPPAPVAATTTPDGTDASAPDATESAAADGGDMDAMPTGDDAALPAASPPSFASQGPTWKGKAAWTSLAVALGFGTVSAVLALSASSQEQDLENLIAFRDSNGQPAEYSGPVRTRYEDFVDKGKTHATWSRIALGAAGISVAAATTFFLLDRSDRKARESRAAHVVPVVSPESVGMAAGWRF